MNPRCPSCGTATRLVRLRDVACFIETDVCDTCVGLFLDKGEADAYVLRTRASTKLLDHASNGMERIEDTLEDIFQNIL